jgi:hypothetical protein
MHTRQVFLIASSLVAATLALCPTGAFAQRTDVDGELKVAETAVPLRYGHAWEMDDVEGVRGDGQPKKSLLLFFTDVQTPPEQATNWGLSAQMAREGKLRAVQIEINPATKQMFSGSLYYALGENEPPNMSISIVGVSTTHQVKDLKVEKDRISGTVLMTEPQKWVRLNDGDKPTMFQYRATFDLPLHRRPAVTAVLTGKQAHTSPQVKTLLAFEDACRKVDQAALKRLATPAATANLRAMIAKAGVAEVRTMFRQMLPVRKPQSVLRVVVRGDRATVIS